MSSKSIVLISSGQPSLNPRLVKEADALCLAGYNVTVIYAYWNDWGTALDKELIPAKAWKAIRAGGSPIDDKLTYFRSRLIYKIAKSLVPIFGLKHYADIAIARSSYYLSRKAKKHKADLYIGHNLGALPATVNAAKINGKPCGFDAEDFHRHEMSDDINDADVKLRAYIENKYVPMVDYLTASSAPIAAAYQGLFNNIQPVVLQNVFPKSTTEANELDAANDEPLKLFWFSQAIGFSRGLENLIEVLKMAPAKFELHLLGACNADFKKMLNEADINVKLHAPIHPDKLTDFAKQFDIGLALEPGFSINNNIALSNKIFTYMQAGLAIVASDTIAQKDLLNVYPEIGKTFIRDDKQSLMDVLLYYNEQRNQLLTSRKASLAIAHSKLNWETESQTFLNLVKTTIGN